MNQPNYRHRPVYRPVAISDEEKRATTERLELRRARLEALTTPSDDPHEGAWLDLLRRFTELTIHTEAAMYGIHELMDPTLTASYGSSLDALFRALHALNDAMLDARIAMFQDIGDSAAATLAYEAVSNRRRAAEIEGLKVELVRATLGGRRAE